MSLLCSQCYESYWVLLFNLLFVFNFILSFMLVNIVNMFFSLFGCFVLLTSINILSFASSFDSGVIEVLNHLLVLD